MADFCSRRTAGSFAILAAGAFPAAAQEDGAPENFRLYGHFSPAVISYDDGQNRYTRGADNAQSGGRIGFWLDFPVRNGRTRFNLETSLGLRNSASLTQFSVPPLFDFGASSVRKLEVIFDTERLGSFSIGQGSMGSDGVTEADLSGTQLAAYVGIADTAGGYFFRTAAGTVSTIRVKDAFPTFDGGRAPRVRWDSPDLSVNRLGTFHFAVSAGLEVSDGNVVVNDSLADAGVFYRNTLGPVDVKASVGFSVADDNGQQKPQSAGSVSLLHGASGLSATLALGARDGGGEYQYSKIGLTRRWFDWGDTAASVDWYRGIDTAGQGSEAESFGVGVVQELDRSNLQFYVGWRRYELTTANAARHRPATSVIFGTRWVFRKLDGVHLRRGRTEVDWSEAE